MMASPGLKPPEAKLLAQGHHKARLQQGCSLPVCSGSLRPWLPLGDGGGLGFRGVHRNRVLGCATQTGRTGRLQSSAWGAEAEASLPSCLPLLEISLPLPAEPGARVRAWGSKKSSSCQLRNSWNSLPASVRPQDPGPASSLIPRNLGPSSSCSRALQAKTPSNTQPHVWSQQPAKHRGQRGPEGRTVISAWPPFLKAAARAHLRKRAQVLWPST